MLVIGFGGLSNGMSLEEDLAFQEVLATKMKELLEAHGWESNYGRDPVLILIEYEEYSENGELDELANRESPE